MIKSLSFQEVLQFFEKFIDSISIELQFVIDDLSTEDSSAVGVTWHLGMFSNYSIYASWYPLQTHI